MSKRRYGLDECKIQAYIKEGRGQGEGVNYKSWIDIHDFPSQGRVSRCFGWKTGRIHHFMSDLETRYFYLLEWSDNIVDIREQYPLLSRDKTLEIAEEKGIRHPQDTATKASIVLTTDFLITVKLNDKIINLARTIKPSRDLEKVRTIEKFEIERAYWEKQGIDWGIVTENEINREFASNIEWVHDAYKLESIANLGIQELEKYIITLKETLLNNSANTLQNVLRELDSEYNFNNGFFLYLLRHMIATKQVVVSNMDKKISINRPISELFSINTFIYEKEKITNDIVNK